MRQRTRLIRDKSGRHKLKVSLPGGRYQLSLDDSAVISLQDGLGIDEGDIVPEPFVRFFVVTGDAWFPRQRDTERIIDDLPADGHLSENEKQELRNYIEKKAGSEIHNELFSRVVEESPVSGSIDLEEHSDNSTEKSSATESDEGLPEFDSLIETEPPSLAETDLAAIPGIADYRGEKLLEAGFQSVEAVAEERPKDIAEKSDLGIELATVAVEGARELVGYDVSTAKRLENETGVTAETFDAALSSLAASGVPPSEAAPVLRTAFGPTVADLQNVHGEQVYYLWEAGYKTPKDIVEANIEQLESVTQIGSATAPKIIESAEKMVD